MKEEKHWLPTSSLMAVFSSSTPATLIGLILNIVQISMEYPPSNYNWGPLTREWEVRIQALG